jgi:hypothetical protein
MALARQLPQRIAIPRLARAAAGRALALNRLVLLRILDPTGRSFGQPRVERAALPRMGQHLELAVLVEDVSGGCRLRILGGAKGVA